VARRGLRHHAPVRARHEGPLYGRALVSESRILDLAGDQVLVYREPSPRGYRLLRFVRRGEQIAPLAFPDQSFLVDDLIG
jgi:hypothetical protein